MASNDWETLGDNIREMVENAVNSRDYERLSQSISNAVNNTISSVSVGINGAINSVNQNNRVREYRNGVSYNSVSNNNRTAQFQRERQQIKQNNTALRVVNKNNAAIFQSTTTKQIVSVMEMAIGYSMAGIMGLSTLSLFGIVAILGVATDVIVSGAITGALAVGFGLMARAGRKRYSMTQRFQSYIRALRGKEYINLDQLAIETRKSLNYIKKDVEKMLKKNWFIQGHLDDQKSCLMVTDRLYKEYKDNLLQSEVIKIEEKDKEENNKYSDDAREVLNAGNDYISKIKRCNDLISGTEMTQKITKIELIVKRIFERIEKHPENIPDIRKMMDYYLPTTVKLLEAYVELDSLPINGDNIASSKQEIENSLDTLNSAFEKLLDELFKDTAWDVSTDISVLKTLLAQDGLTEKDFN